MVRTRDLIVTTLIILLTGLLIIGLVRLLTQITEILLLILISAILAAGISPLVAALQRIRLGRRGRRIPEAGAILIIYAALIVLLVLIGGILLTPLVTETREFITALPQLWQNLQQRSAALEARYTWLPDISGVIARLPGELAGLSRYFGTAAGVAFRFLGGVFSIVTVLFMTFYMLVEGPQIKQQFLTLFPAERSGRVEEILQHIGLKFGGWVRGQLLIGVVVGIGAAALRLPYPLLLGLVAGITELIPIVGPILGAIPAVLIALFQPPLLRLPRVLFVVAFYALVQQTEANFVVPRVMRMAVGISPLLTVIALLVGVKLLGIIGALLSIPVAAALQVVVGEILQSIRRSHQ